MTVEVVLGQEVSLDMAQELELEKDMKQMDKDPGSAKVLEIGEVDMGLGVGLGLDQDQMVVDMGSENVRDMIQVQDVLQDVILVSLHQFQGYQVRPCE